MLYYWLYIHHYFYTLSLNLVTVYLFAENALDFTCLLSLNFFSTIIKYKIIWNSYVWQTEEEKEDNSKQQTTEVLSEPKEKEDPKTEAFADPSEPKDEEQTNDQEHKTETAAEEDSKEWGICSSYRAQRQSGCAT